MPVPGARPAETAAETAADTAADTAAGAAAEAPGRLYGVVDALRPNRIAGWAIDRADAGAALEVEILRDGRPVARVRADRLRRDLLANDLGTGRYGFAVEIAPPVEPGFEFTLAAVARAPDGETAELRRVGAAAPAADPQRRLLEALHLRLAEQAREAEAARQGELSRLGDMAARIELAQARLERALETAVPRGGPGAGLRALVALSLAVGAGSLALGLLSLLGP